MSGRIARRRFLQWAGLGTFGVLVAACAPKPAEPTKPPVAEATQAPAEATQAPPATEPPAPTAAPKEPVKIRWAMYTFEPWLLLLKEIFKEYQAKKPEVTVELVTAPWDQFWPKIEAMASAGDPVNVSIAEPGYTIPWGKRDLMLDLKPILDTMDTSIFYPQAVCSDIINTQTWFEGCKSGGSTLWSFPGNGTAFVVYLNMNLVKEAGLDYPSEDWTWDDFQRYATLMTKDKSGKRASESGFDKENREQYGVTNLLWLYPLKSWIWHAGGRQWNDDQTECMYTAPKAIEAIKYLVDLCVTSGCAPSQGAFEGINQPFLTGKIGMEMTGSWNVDPWVKDIKDFEWDIQRLPVGPGGKENRLSHTGFGNSLSIFKGAKNQEATVDLYKFAVWSKEGSRWFGTSGVPCVKAAAEDKDWLDAPGGQHLPKHREVMLKVLAEESGFNAIEPHALWEGDMWTIISNELPNLSLGRATPEQFAQTICTEIKKVWEKARSS